MESVGKVENMLVCVNHTVAVVGIARLHHSASLARRFVVGPLSLRIIKSSTVACQVPRTATAEIGPFWLQYIIRRRT